MPLLVNKVLGSFIYSLIVIQKLSIELQQPSHGLLLSQLGSYVCELMLYPKNMGLCEKNKTKGCCFSRFALCLNGPQSD